MIIKDNLHKDLRQHQARSVGCAEGEMKRPGEALRRVGEWDRDPAIDWAYKLACDDWVWAQVREVNQYEI